MDLELNDIQQELRSTLARLVRTKYDAANRETILESEQGWSQDMWKSYADMGLLGLPFPAEYGGNGMGFAEVAVVMEQFGTALVLEPFLPTVILGGGLVNTCGTEAQKKHVLPGVCAGETLLAFAGFEPASRYDLSSPATVAKPLTGTDATENGADTERNEPGASGTEIAGMTADFTISGEKSHVLGGTAADYFVVSARTGDGSAHTGDELGVFLVARNSEAVTVDERTQADGLRSAAVVLKDAPAVRLGTGDATSALQYVIDTANAALMSEAVGAMDASLRMTGQYLHTREQFGMPIGANQALQHRAADLYAAVEEAKSMALYAKLAITQGSNDANETRHRDILASKMIVNDVARLVSQEIIQLHGGIGMTMEYPIGHYAKRLTVIPRTFDETDGITQELASLGGLITPYAADISAV